MEIVTLSLYSTHSNQATGEFYNFKILVCETDLQSLTTDFNFNYSGSSPTEVLSLDTLAVDWSHNSPGWNDFNLDLPFQYSGEGNLIIEFRYLGDDGHTVNARAAALPSADRCLSGAHPESNSGSLMSFLTCMLIHYFPSGLSQETFGGVKVVFSL